MKYFNLKKIILLSIVFIFILSFFFVLGPQKIVRADDYGLSETAGQATTLSQETDISGRIGTIIGAGLGFIGILFFILMIYGGFLWMTARGNEEQVKKAIELITQACIGLAIVAAAYLITKFIGEAILGSFTG